MCTITTLAHIQSWSDDLFFEYKKLNINPQKVVELKNSNEIYNIIIKYVTERGAIVQNDKVVLPLSMYGKISQINKYKIATLICYLLDDRYGEVNIEIDKLFPYVYRSAHAYMCKNIFPFKEDNRWYTRKGELKYPYFMELHGRLNYLFIADPDDHSITFDQIIGELLNFPEDIEESDGSSIDQLFEFLMP